VWVASWEQVWKRDSFNGWELWFGRAGPTPRWTQANIDGNMATWQHVPRHPVYRATRQWEHHSKQSQI
jgi:hypothetical protein